MDNTTQNKGTDSKRFQYETNYTTSKNTPRETLDTKDADSTSQHKKKQINTTQIPKRPQQTQPIKIQSDTKSLRRFKRRKQKKYPNDLDSKIHQTIQTIKKTKIKADPKQTQKGPDSK